MNDFPLFKIDLIPVEYTSEPSEFEKNENIQEQEEILDNPNPSLEPTFSAEQLKDEQLEMIMIFCCM